MVEMWCEGLHVPGAWLEAVVHSKAQGCLNLGEVNHKNGSPEHVANRSMEGNGTKTALLEGRHPPRYTSNISMT